MRRMELLESKVKEQAQEIISFHQTHERHERDEPQTVRQATPDRPPRSRYQDDDGHQYDADATKEQPMEHRLGNDQSSQETEMPHRRIGRRGRAGQYRTNKNGVNHTCI
jgi:hypothetical protein